MMTRQIKRMPELAALFSLTVGAPEIPVSIAIEQQQLDLVVHMRKQGRCREDEPLSHVYLLCTPLYPYPFPYFRLITSRPHPRLGRHHSHIYPIPMPALIPAHLPKSVPC